MTNKGTNILPSHKDAFNALASGHFENFALFSCFINGKPGSAIVAVNPEDGEFNITPLFVSVAPGMTLADHEGKELKF